MLGTVISPKNEREPYVRTEPQRRVTGEPIPFEVSRRAVAPGSVDAAPDERVVAELPPPPPDTHYAIETRGETTVVVIEAGPPVGNFDLPPTGDARLRKMNRDARRYWRDQGGNQGPPTERTVAVLPDPGDGGRYELRTSPLSGTIAIVWIAPSNGDEFMGSPPPGADPMKPPRGARPSEAERLNGRIPSGAAGQGPSVRSAVTARDKHNWAEALRARDRASRQRLTEMNRTSKAFWARGPR